MPLVFYACLSGGRKKELELHWQFEEYRTHSEWFVLEGDVKEFVERAAKAFPPNLR